MFASAGLTLLLTTTPVVAGGPPTALPDRAVADAIVRSVRARLGDAVTIVVSSVKGVRAGFIEGTLLASPEPSARIGAPVRFRLSDAQPGRPPVRIGEAVAVLEISAPVVRSTRAIARGERLAASDVAVSTMTLNGRPFRRLLLLEEAIDARSARDLSQDTPLTRADLVTEPLVHAGEIVRAHARVGVVEIVGDMVAAESGDRDDVIRVINQETRHAVRARIAARGEVEVVNAR